MNKTIFSLLSILLTASPSFASSVSCTYEITKNIPVVGLPIAAHEAKKIAGDPLRLISENDFYKTASYSAQYDDLQLKFSVRHSKEVFRQNSDVAEQELLIEIEDSNKQISTATSRIFTSNDKQGIVSLAYHLTVDSVKHDVVLVCY